MAATLITPFLWTGYAKTRSCPPSARNFQGRDTVQLWSAAYRVDILPRLRSQVG
jgi:hypothetical protein